MDAPWSARVGLTLLTEQCMRLANDTGCDLSLEDSVDGMVVTFGDTLWHVSW